MPLGPRRMAEMNRRRYGPADHSRGIGAHTGTVSLVMAHSVLPAPITCCELSPPTGRFRAWHNAQDGCWDA